MKSLNQIMLEVGSGSINALSLLVKIADAYPQVVVDVVNGRGPALDAEIARIYNNGNGYVDAIKHHRTLTGSSLREAKDEVDRVTNHPARRRVG